MQMQMFPAMGITFSSILNQLFGKKDMKILMVGLDAAGMTLMIVMMSEMMRTFIHDDI